MYHIRCAAVALVAAFASFAQAQQDAPNAGPAPTPPPALGGQPLPPTSGVGPGADGPLPPTSGIMPMTPGIPGQALPPTSGVVPPTFPVPGAPAYWAPAQPISAWNNRYWFTNEVLVFWMKNGPLPVPLVTSSSNPTDVGTIGAPSTQVLFGGQGLNFRAFPGWRLTLGTWLDDQRTFGIEGRGTFLTVRTIRENFNSDANGNPTLAIPVFDPRTTSGGTAFVTQPPGATLPGESGLFITQPNNFAGGIAIKAMSHLTGGEFNGLCCLVRDPLININLIGGFRYQDLNDSINLDTLSLGLPASGFIPGTFFYTSDMFRGRSQFYGGQLGFQAGVQRHRWNLTLRSLLALGSTQQTVSVHGATIIGNTIIPNFPPITAPSGILALPTNSGEQNQYKFGIIPDVQLQVGYMLTRTLQLFIGYEFLYWNSVVRPGSQIDGVVNPTQIPVFGGTGLTGPARPMPLFNTTDFWAHGINIGLAWQF